ncbi:flagellar hook-associated protein FlgK [Pseudoduganella sp. GCM10020061]|uniref:flagellar hook-associated protein FlgK n=1 Tax=Pseudoduganella sp. GCM10020061 TaxID=3317345 RepID=UPI0036364285
MAGNLFSIAKSGLLAAQAGLSTTGHNIANANTIGYSRQEVVQRAGTAQDFGYGFVGGGTEISQIKRYSDDFMNTQVRSATATVSSLNSYMEQVTQIDNVLADASSGLSPALQDFFKGVQDAASNPGSTAARQSLLSSAGTLTARFQAIDARLSEVRESVNAQISANVDSINSYAQQIAQLNDSIADYSRNSNAPPNDLLDRRDQLVIDLSKHVRATVTPGTNNSLTVSIGSGQPLVVGAKTFQLTTTTSAEDPSRIEVGYFSNGKVSQLSAKSMQGGELGGLMEFRSESLDRAQNAIGRIAIGLAETFNAQHRLGQDMNGAAGVDFFKLSPITVREAGTNNPASTVVPAVTVDNVQGLTLSDYDMTFDGTDYIVTRIPAGEVAGSFSAVSGGGIIDGLRFDTTSGTATAGDRFRIRPTSEGASAITLNINHVSQIAAAAPIATGRGNNTGNATITEGTVDAGYRGAPLAAPVTFTYDKATNSFTGTIATVPPAAYPSAAPIPYVAGADLNMGGMHFSISGTPNDGDTFTVGPNTGGVGDNRNMRLLGQLQTTNLFDGKTSSFQGSYAQLVSYVGNKTREVQVNASAGQALLNQATVSQQEVSGVNLDEEAANLLKYQQAYQAAGKAMQIASTLFDTLLSLGH